MDTGGPSSARAPEAKGYAGAPRPLAADEHGREILSYIGRRRCSVAWSARCGGRLQNRQRLLASSRPEAGTGRDRLARRCRPVEHGLSGWGAGGVHRLGPGPSRRTSSGAGRRGLVLRSPRRDAWCRKAGFSTPVRRGRRLRLFVDAYGVEERIAVVRAIERSVRRRADLLRFWDLDEKGEADFLESINRDSRGWGRSRRSSSELWREAVGRPPGPAHDRDDGGEPVGRSPRSEAFSWRWSTVDSVLSILPGEGDAFAEGADDE